MKERGAESTKHEGFWRGLVKTWIQEGDEKNQNPKRFLLLVLGILKQFGHSNAWIEFRVFGVFKDDWTR